MHDSRNLKREMNGRADKNHIDRMGRGGQCSFAGSSGAGMVLQIPHSKKYGAFRQARGHRGKEYSGIYRATRGDQKCN